MLDYQGLKRSVTDYSSTGWTAGVLPTVSSVTYNGNRSYDITFAGPVTDYLTPGMRLKTVRQVSAPTQCTSLNGSTQYFNRTSASLTGMTFTDDFVLSAWIKLNSYTNSIIVSRTNTISGWYLQSDASGRISLVGTNAGVGNFSFIRTYQSIPLNKWVHVSAQLDMSSFTVSPTTSYIMIDGVDVPSEVSRSGTNPTSLVQAGNLEIGSYNGGTLPFPGKIAQVAIFNAKVTQATMRGYISQGLSGTETNLVSAYSFNGNANDLNTTNANNLTASGSATATNADSPFSLNGSGTATGTDDYGLIQKISSTVATVQVPVGCTIPTSGGISATYVSTQQAPFNFPMDKYLWEVVFINKTQVNTGSIASSNTITNFTGHRLTVPIGYGELSFSCFGLITVAVATTFLSQIMGLSTTTNSYSDFEIVVRGAAVSASISEEDYTFAKSKSIYNSSATIYYLNSRSSLASNSTQYADGTYGPTIIKFLPSGL